jgi:transposase
LADVSEGERLERFQEKCAHFSARKERRSKSPSAARRTIRSGTVGRNSQLGNRLFVEAVIWKFRSGAPWRDLPERFGDWKNTHNRLRRSADFKDIGNSFGLHP